MTAGHPEIRRSFGYDLFSFIGPDLAKGSVILSAFENKESSWAQATMACSICCETSAKVALGLRAFSECTGKRINRTSSVNGHSLHELFGILVHHREIENVLNSPLMACRPTDEWISTNKQSRHRLTQIIARSDSKSIECPLGDFSTAIADELNHQINSPEGWKLKKDSKCQSS